MEKNLLNNAKSVFRRKFIYARTYIYNIASAYGTDILDIRCLVTGVEIHREVKKAFSKPITITEAVNEVKSMRVVVWKYSPKAETTLILKALSNEYLNMSVFLDYAPITIDGNLDDYLSCVVNRDKHIMHYEILYDKLLFTSAGLRLVLEDI